MDDSELYRLAFQLIEARERKREAISEESRIRSILGPAIAARGGKVDLGDCSVRGRRGHSGSWRIDFVDDGDA